MGRGHVARNDPGRYRPPGAYAQFMDKVRAVATVLSMTELGEEPPAEGEAADDVRPGCTYTTVVLPMLVCSCVAARFMVAAPRRSTPRW